VHVFRFSFRFAAVFVLLFALHARSQVMQDLDLEHELKAANENVAGTRADDLPHQLHYELKMFNLHNQESHATYDIYRRAGEARVEMAAEGYKLTRIVTRDGKKTWENEVGREPLQLFDFQTVLTGPSAASSRLSIEQPRPTLAPQMVDQAPYLCADDGGGTVLCFDPLLHTFAFAQTFNQTVVYDRWLKVGLRYVPAHIQIFEGKRQLLEATGTVLPASQFPAGTFSIPDEPQSAAAVDEHPIVKQEQSQEATWPVFGTVVMQLMVDANGKVKKVSVIDADDKRLEGSAKHYAKGTTYAPYLVNGQPQPFETVLWYRQYPPPGNSE
jgi:hypothetical protein